MVDPGSMVVNGHEVPIGTGVAAARVIEDEASESIVADHRTAEVSIAHGRATIDVASTVKPNGGVSTVGFSSNWERGSQKFVGPAPRKHWTSLTSQLCAV